MRKRTILPTLIIIIFWGIIVGYNDLFLRHEPANSAIIEQINPIPYAAYFELKNNKPHAVFQTPVFPNYNTYCHEAWKPCQFMPFQQLYGDLLRIGSIQYVWMNIGEKANASLAVLLDTLTTIAPYWRYPYVFGQLIVPMQKSLDESGSGTRIDERKRSREDAVVLGKKWEFFLCEREKWVNPCGSYELPHYLAFNQFYYLGDSERAAEQYRISAMHSDAPALTSLMAALVYGRGGEHLKSATLRYDRFLSLSENAAALSLADDQQNSNTSEAEKTLGKAIFEVQLQLITEAADKHPACWTSYQCLQKKGAISKSVEYSWNDLCNSGKNDANIRCILMKDGIERRVISLDGKLIYPSDSTFQFRRSEEFNSRRAQPTIN